MDGRVEHSGAPSSEEPTEFREPSREVDLESDANAPEAELEQEGSFHFANDLELGADHSVASEPEPSPEYDPDQVSQEPTEVVYSAGASNPDAASPDLSDIARFGNSDSTANEGPLRYCVFVAGIDTADVRESFREAITDRKMMWDTDEILRSIKGGEVELRNISPAKAYIIISRLRTLPVHIRWEQHAIAQT